MQGNGVAYLKKTAELLLVVSLLVSLLADLSMLIMVNGTNITMLTIVAVTALLAAPALGIVSHNVPMISNVEVHADEQNGYIPSQNRQKPFGSRWDKIPGVGEDQDESSFNKKVGAVSTNSKPVTVTRNGHTMTVVPYAQIPGKIIKVDGQPVTSKAQVISMLDSKSGNSNNESDSEGTSNGQSTNKPEYQSKGTNHGKLVQTGEHSTARKAGIAAVIIALVAFVIFKFRKVSKHN